MNTIIISVLVVGLTGLLIGLLLSIAGKKLEVKTDERESAVRDALPGNNCGGCGYPGCDGVAAAIVKGEAPVNACPVGGAPVAREIAAIMGQEAGEDIRMTAFVRCAGTCDKAKKDYTYTGVESCTMMAFVPGGGPKSCNEGCLGFGTCVKACQFDAIHVINGVAVVDKERCKACGACAKACPKKLIELVPYEGKNYHVQCACKEKGKAAMDACLSSCIGCRKCAKNCPAQAITVENNIARINYEKCENCGLCMEGCPRGCITSF